MRRARLLLAALAGWTAGCDDPPAPPSAACSTQTDCAPDELCFGGYCLARPEGTADAGVMAGRDASARDAAAADAQSAPDAASFADAAPAADAALPADVGCAGGISILGSITSYCTITEAIAAAQPGEVVSVGLGRYNESVELNKAIALVGVAETATTLTGAPGVPVVRVTAEGARLAGFRLEAQGAPGIDVNGTLLAEQLSVHGAAGAGVLVRRTGSAAASVELQGVLIEGVSPDGAGAAYGLDLGPGTEGLLGGSTISDSTYEGVFVRQASLTLQLSTVDSAGRRDCDLYPASCRPGVHAVEGSTVVVRGFSVIRNCGGSGLVAQASTVRFDHSSSTGNGRQAGLANGVPSDGLSLIDGATGNLVTSWLNNNLGYGLSCTGGQSQVSDQDLTTDGNGIDASNC